MLNNISNQLRLHIEDGVSSASSGLDLPAWGNLQAAYAGLTGWELDCQRAPLPARAELISAIPKLFGGDDGQMYRQRTSSTPTLELSETHARDLAQAIAGVLVELQATRAALQDREAELATAIPVIARQSEEADFNQRLQAILRGAVEGLHGRAAALYLLDDTTSELKLRRPMGAF